VNLQNACIYPYVYLIGYLGLSKAGSCTRVEKGNVTLIEAMHSQFHYFHCCVWELFW